MKHDLKLFFQYTLPSIAGMLIAGTFCVIDTFFIGKSMGDIGLAALAITWPLVMIIGAIGDMFGTGGAIIISQARGSGETQKARLAFSNTMFSLFCSALLFMGVILWTLPTCLNLLGATSELFPLSYDYSLIMILGSLASIYFPAWLALIRNDGRPVFAMWVLIIGLLSNIVLDYIFIFPLNWGVKGAAWATICSHVIISIIGVGYFCSSYCNIKPKRSDFKLDFSMIMIVFKNGFPSFGNQLSIIAMLFLHNFQSLSYGGVAGLAAYTLIATIESIGSLLMTGLSAGIQPLVAYFYGSGRHKRKRIIGIWGYITALIFGIVLTIISILGYNTFPQWFGLSGEVAQLAGHGLILSSGAFVLLGVVRVAGYYFQASNKLFQASIIIYGDAFFALPLCLFILPLIFGLNGVWLAMPISRVILFMIVCYFWFGHKLKRNKTYAK